MSSTLLVRVDAVIPASLLPHYEGGFKARFLALAGFTLVVYEYCLTFEQEVKYIWAGPWSISKILFLWNRYFSPVVLILGLICLYGENLSNEFCSRVLEATFTTDYIGITVVQAIIVLRVWYIFSGRRFARAFILCVFIASVISATRNFAVLYPGIGNIHPGPLPLAGCPAPPPIYDVWKVFLPYLISQTVLFGATTWPAIQLYMQGRRSQLLSRLVRDGGVFYVVVLVSAAFTTIGSIQRNDVSLLYTAVFSNFLLAISSVAVTRLILSIGSLATCLTMNPETLLSTAELSRIRWRRGAYDGEIIVEKMSAEDPLEMVGVQDPSRPSTPGFYMTRVGVYDDMVLPISGTSYKPQRPKSIKDIAHIVNARTLKRTSQVARRNGEAS